MSIVENGAEFLDVLDGDEDLVGRVLAKLEREPVEDLRIDFEDGYGTRPDEEEDETARRAGSVLAQWVNDGEAPPFHGIRFKSLEQPTRAPWAEDACPLPRVARWAAPGCPPGSWSPCPRSPRSTRSRP